jgi:hypothetical protein
VAARRRGCSVTTGLGVFSHLALCIGSRRLGGATEAGRRPRRFSGGEARCEPDSHASGSQATGTSGNLGLHDPTVSIAGNQEDVRCLHLVQLVKHLLGHHEFCGRQSPCTSQSPAGINR